jgi:hypothetical protein
MGLNLGNAVAHKTGSGFAFKRLRTRLLACMALVFDLQSASLQAEGSRSDARSRQSGGRGQSRASTWRHRVDYGLHQGIPLGPGAGVRGAPGGLAADLAGLGGRTGEF